MTPSPLNVTLAAILETALNQLLSLDPTSRERSKALYGKVLKLELQGVPAVWLTFSSQQVDVLTCYEHPAHASISLKWQGLSLLRQPEKLSRYIREERLDLQGDPSLFNVFSQLFHELDIDWEEQLSGYTGDVLAHWLCRGLNHLKHTVMQQGRLTHQDLREALTEEWQLAPGALQVAAFCDDVSTLAEESEQLLLRADRLLQRSQA